MKFIRPVVYIAMLGLIGFGFYLLSPGSASMSGRAETKNPPTAYIETNEINASFKLGGRISEVLVKEGDTVKKGQVLARIQNDELQAKVNQAQAAAGLAQGKLAEAQGAASTAQAKRDQGQSAVKLTADTVEAQVQQAQAAVNAAQAKVDALKAGARPEERKQMEIQLAAAKDAMDFHQQTVTKLTQAAAQGKTTQADVEKEQAAYQEAKVKYELAQQQAALVDQGPREEEVRGAEAMLEQAKAALRLAVASREQVGVRQGDVKAAEASTQQALGAVQSAQSGGQQAQAALTEAQTYLGYSELVAPADGVIVSQSAQLGELVGSGFPVFTVQESGDRWAKFFFPETDLPSLKTGDKVKLRLISNGQEVQGEIGTIAPAADFAVKKASQSAGETDVRSFGVKVRLSQLPESARTGMTVQWTGEGGESNAH